MRLITVVMTGIMLAGACLGQSSSYPGSVDTDATLFVAKDNVQTKLNVQMLITDNVAIVASTTGWAANMIATVDSEQMFVTGVSGSNVLQVTRGFAGTAAAAHNAGKNVSNFIDAAYQKVLKSASINIETALGANLGNIGTLSGNNTWSGTNTFSGTLSALGANHTMPL